MGNFLTNSDSIGRDIAYRNWSLPKECDHNTYAKLGQLQSKIALVLRHDPSEKKPLSALTDEFLALIQSTWALYPNSKVGRVLPAINDSPDTPTFPMPETGRENGISRRRVRDSPPSIIESLPIYSIPRLGFRLSSPSDSLEDAALHHFLHPSELRLCGQIPLPFKNGSCKEPFTAEIPVSAGCVKLVLYTEGTNNVFSLLSVDDYILCRDGVVECQRVGAATLSPVVAVCFVLGA